MKPAAFQATFSDFKLIKGRKVAQIVLEVDISAADAALETLGGVPRPDKEAWVAVARIKAVSEPTTPSNDAPKERRPFNELPLPQQAGIRCGEVAFHRFLQTLPDIEPFEVGNDDCAAHETRSYCRVDSRSEILSGTVAGNRWLLLESGYQVWLTEAAHVEA